MRSRDVGPYKSERSPKLRHCANTNDNATMNECKAYIENIYKSIKQNLNTLDPNEDLAALQGVVDAFRAFYVSLFAQRIGVFGQRQMDEQLAKAAPRIDKPREETQRPTVTPEPRTRKGLGKGSPGCARKQKVTKRQDRTRATTAFTSRKRQLPADSQSVTATRQPPRKIAPRRTEGETSTRSSDPPAETSSSSSSSTVTIRSPQARPAQKETRQALCAQTNSAYTGLKRVQLIQKLRAAGERDQPPNDRELEAFWQDMDMWDTLDARVVTGLQRVWNDVLADKDTSLVEKILRLSRTPNGVVNCVHHLVGHLVREHVKETNSSGRKVNFTAGCEELEKQIREIHYARYVETLQICSCNSCDAVLEFDANYTRYHDNQENEDSQETIEPVLFGDRPMHCDNVELIAQTMRTHFSGFSATTLLKSLYFANSTPSFSPPALALATPTDVQATATKFMEPFLRERKLQDPLPSSWKIPRANHNDHHLVKIPKQSLHVFDADSGEITLDQDSEHELHGLATDRNKVRFRLRNCDAPETEFSTRIYKQGDGSATLSAFLTRHIGIEALRVARQTLFEASEVLVQVEKDQKSGRLFAPKDAYGRRLVNMFLRNSHGAIENFAEKLASLGYTLSFYTTGIDVGIDSAMREAIAEKRGIFNLPEELFTYPYRPWDLRKLWKDDTNERTYGETRPILNRPSDPSVWARTEPDGLAKAIQDDDDDDLPDSQDSDNFLFRIVRCKMYWETRCYSAESQIPDAGRGLFIKPHKEPIAVGEHLCLYAEKSTTLEEMDARESSRVYAMYVPRKKLWFDSEVETGNNLGRFANQRGVLQALEEIRRLSTTTSPQLTEEDWKKVEKHLDEQCNARYDTVGNQLVIKAKRQLEPSKEPTELFVNYGGLREYWIPLILKHLTDVDFPATLRRLVAWLTQSHECNWTAEQRRIWAVAE